MYKVFKLVGALLFITSLAWADRATLQNGSGNEIGTQSNPVIVSLGTAGDTTFNSVTVSDAAGVKITGDGDGAITFLGLGDGNDESLTINLDDFNNIIQLTSATGATEIIGIASYSLGGGGVRLTGDGDGAITFQGLGDGTDENLQMNLDDTANTVSLTSSTGVVDIRFDAGAGVGQFTLDGATGGCIMLRDTDDAGWTECDALDGTLSCSVDVDGVCD